MSCAEASSRLRDASTCREVMQPSLRSLFVPCLGEWKPPETQYAMTLVVRTTGNITGLDNEIRQKIEERGRQFAYRVATGEDLVARSVKNERTLAKLSTLFGALSLVPTSVGLYALITIMANSRRREIAIRIAVGASHFDVTTLLLKEILIIILAGEVIGIALALMGQRFVQTLLFSTLRSEVWPVLLAITLTIFIGALAVYMPLYRLVHADTSRVLRID
jgi:ABC-type antimicrobial peptide transport system permease subunit